MYMSSEQEIHKLFKDLLQGPLTSKGGSRGKKGGDQNLFIRFLTMMILGTALVSGNTYLGDVTGIMAMMRPYMQYFVAMMMYDGTWAKSASCNAPLTSFLYPADVHACTVGAETSSSILLAMTVGILGTALTSVVQSRSQQSGTPDNETILALTNGGEHLQLAGPARPPATDPRVGLELLQAIGNGIQLDGSGGGTIRLTLELQQSIMNLAIDLSDTLSTQYGMRKDEAMRQIQDAVSANHLPMIASGQGPLALLNKGGRRRRKRTRRRRPQAKKRVKRSRRRRRRS